MKAIKKLQLGFLFLFFIFPVALAIPSGSTIQQYFPFCKELNITIYGDYPIDTNEISAFPNCSLLVNQTYMKMFSCKCYDGYTAKIWINPFAVNRYTIVYSYLYAQSFPETIVRHEIHRTYIDQRKFNYTNITNFTVTEQKIDKNLTEEIRSLEKKIESINKTLSLLKSKNVTVNQVEEKKSIDWIGVLILSAVALVVILGVMFRNAILTFLSLRRSES